MISVNCAGGMPSPTMSISPFLSLQHRNGRIVAEFEGELVEIGHAWPVIVLVALEHDALARNPFDEFEGAGADRLLAPIGAGLLDFFLGDDIGEIDRHQMQEGGVGPRQRDGHGLVVGARMPESSVALPPATSS